MESGESADQAIAALWRSFAGDADPEGRKYADEAVRGVDTTPRRADRQNRHRLDALRIERMAARRPQRPAPRDLGARASPGRARAVISTRRSSWRRASDRRVERIRQRRPEPHRRHGGPQGRATRHSVDIRFLPRAQRLDDANVSCACVRSGATSAPCVASRGWGSTGARRRAERPAQKSGFVHGGARPKPFSYRASPTFPSRKVLVMGLARGAPFADDTFREVIIVCVRPRGTAGAAPVIELPRTGKRASTRNRRSPLHSSVVGASPNHERGGGGTCLSRAHRSAGGRRTAGGARAM